MSVSYCAIQLPNRLGKMLAPLHWHDYRKKYGKLDDFVASHLEVCLIPISKLFHVFLKILKC